MPTDRPTDQFSYLIALEHYPSCPICGAPLRQDSVAFLSNTAVCRPCGARNESARHPALYATQMPELVRDTTRLHGLIWYTPRNAPGCTALEIWHLRRSEPTTRAAHVASFVRQRQLAHGENGTA